MASSRHFKGMRGRQTAPASCNPLFCHTHHTHARARGRRDFASGEIRVNINKNECSAQFRLERAVVAGGLQWTKLKPFSTSCSLNCGSYLCCDNISSQPPLESQNISRIRCPDPHARCSFLCCVLPFGSALSCRGVGHE